MWLNAMAMGVLTSPSFPLGLGSSQWVSTGNALAAHLWPLLMECMSGERGEGANALCPFGIIVNARRLLGLPDNYFGNCGTVPHDPAVLPTVFLMTWCAYTHHASTVANDPAEGPWSHPGALILPRQGHSDIAG
jgi:hypothetical protein